MERTEAQVLATLVRSRVKKLYRDFGELRRLTAQLEDAVNNEISQEQENTKNGRTKAHITN